MAEQLFFLAKMHDYTTAEKNGGYIALVANY